MALAVRSAGEVKKAIAPLIDWLNLKIQVIFALNTPFFLA
jgi:hypothetical protein